MKTPPVIMIGGPFFLIKSERQYPLAHAKIRHWVNDGYIWLGMVSIQDCLDTIPHDQVLKALQKLCQDKVLVNLVGEYLLVDRKSSLHSFEKPQYLSLKKFSQAFCRKRRNPP